LENHRRRHVLGVLLRVSLSDETGGESGESLFVNLTGGGGIVWHGKWASASPYDIGQGALG